MFYAQALNVSKHLAYQMNHKASEVPFDGTQFPRLVRNTPKPGPPSLVGRGQEVSGGLDVSTLLNGHCVSLQPRNHCIRELVLERSDDFTIAVERVERGPNRFVCDER